MGNIFPKIFLKTKERSSQNNALWPQEGATPPSVGSSTLASTWQCEWRFCANYPDSPWLLYELILHDIKGLTLLIRSGISTTSLRHLDQASSLIFGGRGQNAKLNCSKKKKKFWSRKPKRNKSLFLLRGPLAYISINQFSLPQIPDPSADGPVCDILCARNATALYWVRLSQGGNLMIVVIMTTMVNIMTGWIWL